MFSYRQVSVRHGSKMLFIIIKLIFAIIVVQAC